MKFAIRVIHQIEMTSECNLRCKYCTHPNLGRPKIHMSAEVYAKALKWASYFAKRNRPPELNLAGIGESTMHPEFVRNVYLAREAVGERVELIITTNGLLVDDKLAAALVGAHPRVFVSAHRPERAGLAIEALRKVGLLAGVSFDPSVAAVDWAGQVKWFVSAPKGSPCPWVSSGRAFVMSDGRVSRCCFDSDGRGVFATLDDDLLKFATSPYSLCKTCHHDVGVPFEQEQVA